MPEDFWVIDQQKVPEEDKLAWITQEIGKDTSLREFGCKFVELFSDKIRDVCSQKKGVLKLYHAAILLALRKTNFFRIILVRSINQFKPVYVYVVSPSRVRS